MADPITAAGRLSTEGLQAASLYRRMLLIRRLEERVQSLFLRGEVYGTTHLCSGQEAVSIGVACALEDGDRVACTYRGHGHLLARGLSPEKLLAELLGRSTGVNGGRAGSMNMVDLDHGVIGCFGIVGGSIAAATGAALAFKGSQNIAAAFFGDGAANQAYFFECLNFARVLSLPLLFVCENNGYGEYTAMDAVTAGTITARAQAMEIPTVNVDGMDVWAVREAAVETVARVRSESTPVFLEARTYRFVGHSRSDPGKYRPEGELEQWQERDPLLIAERRLQEVYGVTPEAIQEVAEEVERELTDAEEAALAAPFPTPGAYAEFKT